jgi:hypothetical protein
MIGSAQPEGAVGETDSSLDFVQSVIDRSHVGRVLLVADHDPTYAG